MIGNGAAANDCVSTVVYVDINIPPAVVNIDFVATVDIRVAVASVYLVVSIARANIVVPTCVALIGAGAGGRLVATAITRAWSSASG